MSKRGQELIESGMKVLFDEAASRYTSLGVGGKLACLAFPRNEEELRALLACAAEEGSGYRGYYVVGNWSNTIVADNGWAGLVISLKDMNKLQWQDKGNGRYEILAEAGVMLSKIVAWCASRGITGMEFCAGIPGTVGGAVKMNAGAFGWELKDVISAIRTMEANGNSTEIPASELSFSYRNLALSPTAIITAVRLQLSAGDKKTIAQIIAAHKRHRREKHPLAFPSAGSVFKNDQKETAGLLIEKAGLKGKRCGGAQISSKHGNFIINRGGASAADVLSLIRMAQAAVLEHSGVNLELEIKMLGFENVETKKQKT